MMRHNYERFENYLVGCLAIIAGAILIYLAILGPLWMNEILYKTSESAKYQTMAQDLINLCILAPLLLMGGVLTLIHDERNKHLLILTPVYLLYYALSYGIGMEWSDNRYTGNSQYYFWAFLGVMIIGLIILMYIPGQFSDSDVPEFSRRQLMIYITLVAIFLLVFAFQWILEVREVLQTGNTSSGSYLAAPTVFWVIRYFDLGISIPLGFISLYLLATRTKTAYPYILLFFGFFVTMILTVNTMGLFMYFNNDPELQQADLYVFWALGILALTGYLILVKDKIGGIMERNNLIPARH